MGLGSLQTKAASSDLWKTAVKKDGTEMPWIKECEDATRLEAEEPKVADAIDKALNAWLASDADNAAKLKDFKQGFSMQFEGMNYRIIQFSDGHLKISRWKPKGSGGSGYGGGKSSYIHMRVVKVAQAHFEEANDLINSQDDNDNWQIISVVDRADDKGGPIYVMTNSKPYTPKAEDGQSTGDSSSAESKEEE